MKKFKSRAALLVLAAVLVFLFTGCQSSPPGPPQTPSDQISPTWPIDEEGSRKVAENFIRNSPTFSFDGIEESLSLERTEDIVIKSEGDGSEKPYQFKGWEFTFRFESRHAGYGDRSGQQLLQVITPHKAVILVEQGRVKSAFMDGVWDMVNQRMLGDMEISLAPIHVVKAYILESFPPQVKVFIKGGLGDSCTTYRDAAITREGTSINIEVTTQRPRDAVCAQVYTFFERTLDLGSDFATGVTYDLKVNDYVTTFEVH